MARFQMQMEGFQCKALLIYLEFVPIDLDGLPLTFVRGRSSSQTTIFF